jgi:acetylornithine deacetylase/succinyl-diaminopimelate desuccinylase-like protein
MTAYKTQFLDYIETHQSEFLSEFYQFLKIPSVSTDPANKSDMQKAADWLVNKLAKLGFKNVQAIPTDGHPIVFAEKIIDPQKPTVLIYGHYDVQPAEPLELWQTEPFTPSIRDGQLFARGASDMKGQIMASIFAIQMLQDLKVDLPANIKFILEGEEEIGSPNFAAFIKKHQALLKSDFSLNPDAGMVSSELPTIVYGLRGLAYFELRVYGPQRDLHSGIFGGVVHNPANVLCDAISGMHDSEGRITLPGFYDNVLSITPEEKVLLQKLPIDDQYYMEKTGVSELWGEKPFSAVERIGARPTLDINGLYSGFIQEGSKTIIPSYAMAKISCRLVPDQDPKEVHKQLKSYLEQKLPSTVRWELLSLNGGYPSVVKTDSPITHALAEALETVWGVPAVFKREGGSIPIVEDIKVILGIPSILTGFGLPDDNIHSPNEKLDLPTWKKGIATLALFIQNLSTIKGAE